MPKKLTPKRQPKSASRAPRAPKFDTPPAALDVVQSYRHAAKRKNIPPAGLAFQGKLREAPKMQYEYNPHLPPVLRFDASGASDKLPELLQTARADPSSSKSKGWKTTKIVPSTKPRRNGSRQ